MKTAQEYINESGFSDGDQFGVEAISKIINIARKEAIEECAKRAKMTVFNVNRYGQDCGEVDKQSILNLINEVK